MNFSARCRYSMFAGVNASFANANQPPFEFVLT